MSTKTTKTDFQELEELIKKNDNLLIAMVHPSLYGPLRGLNFILDSPNASLVDFYMNEGCESINQKVWEKTGMAARIMVLPDELILDMETPPKAFKTIPDGEAHIIETLNKHTLKDDPFYFRLGIL